MPAWASILINTVTMCYIIMRKAARAPVSIFMGIAMYLAGFCQPSLKLFNLQLNLH